MPARLSINKSPFSSQTNRLSIKVVIPINCDATLLQPAEQGKNETLRRERGRERQRYVTLWMCPSSHRRCCIWKPRRCSWRCRRYSPSSRHQRSVWLVFLAWENQSNVEVKLVLGNATKHISWIKKQGDCGKHNTPCNAQATRHGLNRGGVVINIGFESRQVQPLD